MPLLLQLWYKYCILYQKILFQYGSSQIMEKAEVPISPHTPQNHTQRHIHTYTMYFQFGVCAALCTTAFDTKHTFALAVFGMVSFILGVILSNISDFLQCSTYLFCCVDLAWTISTFSMNSHFIKWIV